MSRALFVTNFRRESDFALNVLSSSKLCFFGIPPAVNTEEVRRGRYELCDVASSYKTRRAKPRRWAIGEVASSPHFTHDSSDDFRVVHASITGGKSVTTGR